MSDSINPQHYQLPSGLQLIDLTEHMNFCRGNAMKYLFRAGRKSPEKELEDLEKARWYIDREISRLQRQTSPTAPANMKLVLVESTEEIVSMDVKASPGRVDIYHACPPKADGTPSCGVEPSARCLWRLGSSG